MKLIKLKLITVMLLPLAIISMLLQCNLPRNEKNEKILTDLKNIYLRDQDVKDIVITEKDNYTFVYNKGVLDIMYCQRNNYESRPIILVNFTSDIQAKYYYERVRNFLIDSIFISEINIETDSVISIIESDISFNTIGHNRYHLNNDIILKEKVKDNFYNK